MEIATQNFNPSTSITLGITEKIEDQTIICESTWFTETSFEKPTEKGVSIALIRCTLMLFLINMVLVHQYYFDVIGDMLNIGLHDDENKFDSFG